MELFRKTTNICKICGKNVEPDFYISDVELCVSCGIKLECDIKNWQEQIPYYQKKANFETDASTKISYLTTILGMLYDYKIRYFDKDFKIFEFDIYDKIDQVIDAISYARIECEKYTYRRH